VQMFFVFFSSRRRHTRLVSDWSSDVCSSDLFRSLGVPAGEVAGGCFCCRFDDLVAEADRIIGSQAIDVLLAEAVGSCTDLVATVYRPLHRLFPGRFELLPFSVLVEPGRVDEMSPPHNGVPPPLPSLFVRQLPQ